MFPKLRLFYITHTGILAPNIKMLMLFYMKLLSYIMLCQHYIRGPFGP